jgi:hypothetical protein
MGRKGKQAMNLSKLSKLAEELAESWVNGNRTWVVDQILEARIFRRDTALMVLLVYRLLLEEFSVDAANKFMSAIQSRRCESKVTEKSCYKGKG